MDPANDEESLTIALISEEIEFVEDPTSVIAQMRRLQELNKNGALDDLLCTEDYEYVKNYDYRNYGYQVDDDGYDNSEDDEYEDEDEEEFEDLGIEQEESEKEEGTTSCLVQDILDDGPVVYESIHIASPIKMNRVRLQFPDNRIIGTLPLTALADHLEMPLNVTVTTWREIAYYFRITPSVLQKLENSQRSCLDLLEYVADQPAQELVFALEFAGRIDVLAFLKTFNRKNRDNYIFDLHSASTYQLTSSSIQVESPAKMKNTAKPVAVVSPLSKIVNGPPIIFINHFEVTSKEKTNYKWLMKNLKMNFKNFNFQIIDIADVEQQLSTVQEIYKNALHVIICYNESYLNMLETDEVATKFRKTLHLDTQSEFYSNDRKNYRFRSVLMPGMKQSEKTGWAPITQQYAFPDDLQGLLNRIIDPKITL